MTHKEFNSLMMLAMRGGTEIVYDCIQGKDNEIKKLKKELKQCQKETAEKILTVVGNMYEDDGRFRFKQYQWHKNLCKEYGVEVE